MEGVWRVRVPAGPTVDQLLAHALSGDWSVHRVDPGTPGATFTTHKEVSSLSGTPEAPPANEAPEGPWGQLMTPLARYLCSVVVRSQGWLAPVLVFAALCSVDVTIGGASTGNSLPTFATDAALLLPVAIWLTVVVGNCEDPVQAAITVYGRQRDEGAPGRAAGGVRRVRAFVVLSVVLAWATTGTPPLSTTLEGFAAHLIAAATGVGVGALCMRPVLDRRVWAVLIGVFVTLAEVIVPSFPPDRQLLVLLGSARHPHLGSSLAVIAAESAAIAAVLVSAAIRVGRART